MKSKKDFENLLQHEKDLFEAMVSQLEGIEKKIDEQLNGYKENKNLLLRILWLATRI